MSHKIPPEIVVNYTTPDQRFFFPISSEAIGDYLLAFNKGEQYFQRINTLAKLVYYDRYSLFERYFRETSNSGGLRNKLVFDVQL